MFIGGLNWGLIGIGAFLGKNLNIINWIFGRWTTLEWIIYILVGIAAVMSLFSCKCKICVAEAPISSNM